MHLKLSREIKIGVAVIVTLAASYWGVNFLKGIDIFSTSRKIYAVYPRVNGLMRSNPVMINGLNVGKVSDIIFKNDTSKMLVVEMSITHDLPIPKNSVAQIYNADLLGSKAVEIILGNSKEYVKNQDTILSGSKASLEDEVSRQVLPLKAKAESLMGSFDTLLIVISKVMNEKTRDNLIKSFASIRNTIKHLEVTSSTIDTIVTTQKGRMSEIITNIDLISRNIRNNNQQITNAINNVSKMTDTLAAVHLSQTIISTQRALQNFEQISEKINKGKGSLGMLINNDTLYNQLEGSSRNLNLLLQDMKAHPSKYVHFSVFGKREKSK
ncbi:MAG: MlaD family protein [Bacteroidota bacterium]|nr:MlaD family protein [Bacteroidota bacterium]